jgi:hypothetical protein
MDYGFKILTWVYKVHSGLFIFYFSFLSSFSCDFILQYSFYLLSMRFIFLFKLTKVASCFFYLSLLKFAFLKEILFFNLNLEVVELRILAQVFNLMSYEFERLIRVYMVHSSLLGFFLLFLSSFLFSILSTNILLFFIHFL